MKNRLVFSMVIVIFLCYSMFGNDLVNLPLTRRKADPKIWMSMSVCYGENTQIHGKGKYPYTYAATLSTRLWRKVTDGEVNVLLTIVYNEDTNMDALEKYVESFDDVEGVVIKSEEATSLGCVLQSQLSRIFGWQHKFMNDEDIILTTDVDMFVMDKRIMEPLRQPFLSWIYEYEHTVNSGEPTFPMELIGMRAKDWRAMFDNINVGMGKYDIIQNFNDSFHMNLNNAEINWYIDQIFLSYYIVSRGYCTLAKESPLWTFFKLTPSPSNDEENQDHPACYKGDLLCCQRERGRDGGCLLWHFFPDEGEEAMKSAFDTIIEQNELNSTTVLGQLYWE